jgi:hypothetical protein
MRIYGPNGTSVVANAPQARRSGAGTFALDSKEPARRAGAPPAAKTIGSIDALIALQGVENATERRRRGIKRGRLALDALDALKLSLLAGSLDTATLARLKGVVAELAEITGDHPLDAVLAEISLRVEVELAKFGPPRSGADSA